RSRLGQRAVREGKRFVELRYLPTEKNRPALEFLTHLGDQHRNEAGTAWTFPAEYLAGVEYNPDATVPVGQELRTIGHVEKLTPRLASGFGDADRSERLQRIGENLCDIDRIATAIEEYRLGKQPLDDGVDAAPGNSLQTALINIWRKVLGRPRIGMNDNFFEAGGTSLRAVQVIAMIKKELKQNLSIVSLFECPTVALLAAKLNATSGVAGVGT